jgi:hypothetical protein
MNGIDGHQVYPADGSNLTREDTAISKVSTVQTAANAQSWWKTVVQMLKHFTQ